MNKIMAFLALLAIVGASYAAAGDPTQFGNSTTTTCRVGGSAGIVNCTGNGIFAGNMTAANLFGYLSYMSIINPPWNINGSSVSYTQITSPPWFVNGSDIAAVQITNPPWTINSSLSAYVLSNTVQVSIRTNISSGLGMNYTSADGIARLNQSGITAGIYGGANQTPVCNIDLTGRLTTCSNTTTSIQGGQVLSPPWTVNATLGNYALSNTIQTSVRTNVSNGTGISYVSSTGVFSLNDTYALNSALASYATSATVQASVRSNVSSGLGMNYTSADGIIRLNQSGVTAGIYGGANQSESCSFDLTGRAISCSNVTTSIQGGQVLNPPWVVNTTLGNYALSNTVQASVRSNVSNGTGIAYSSATGVFSLNDTYALNTALASYALSNTVQSSVRTNVSNGTGIAYSSATGVFSLNDTYALNSALASYATSATIQASARTNVSSGLGMNYTSADGIIRLNQSGITSGIYGGANQSSVCSYDLTGRATTCSNVTTSIQGGQVLNPPWTVNGSMDNYALSNTIQASVRSNVSSGLGMNYTSADGIIRINQSGVTTGIYGGANQTPVCNYDITGRATTCSNVTTSIQGGQVLNPPWTVNGSLGSYATSATIQDSVRTNVSSGLGMNYTSADGILRVNQSGVTTGIYGGANQTPVCNYDLTGRATTCSNVTTSIQGGQVLNPPWTVNATLGNYALTNTVQSSVRSNVSNGTGISYVTATGVISLNDTYALNSALANYALSNTVQSSVRSNVSNGTGISYVTATGVISLNDTYALNSALANYATTATIQASARTNVSSGLGMNYTSADGIIRVNQSGVTAGIYGGTTQSAVCSFDLTGRAISCSNASITAGAEVDPKWVANSTLVCYASDLPVSVRTNVSSGLGMNYTSADGIMRLNQSGVTGGIYGGANQSDVCTYDLTGRVTSCSNVSISIQGGQVLNPPWTVNATLGSYVLSSTLVASITGNETDAKWVGNSTLVCMSSTLQSSVRTNISSGLGMNYTSADGIARINQSGVTTGIYGGANQSAVCNYDLTGRATTCSNVSMAISANQITAGTQSNTTHWATGVTGGIYGGANTSITYTVDQYGRLNASTNTTMAISGNQVTAGTVADARLSSNVPLEDGLNVYSANQTMSANMTVGGAVGMISLGNGGYLKWNSTCTWLCHSATACSYVGAPGGC
jgi:hypothetical protein